MDLYMTAKEIKSFVSIKQVLSSMYGLEVRKRIPCPIHEGTNNNFSISADFFKCFSCGASGDIFKLVQVISNVDFIRAKNLICEYFNLAPTYRNNPENEVYKMRLNHIKQKQEASQILKKVRDYQQARICQVLRTMRTSEGNSFLEKHLEGLLTKFDQRAEFFIMHDIHAHLISLLHRHIANRNL